MSGVYRYDDILFRRPQGFHSWRQSDCLSITSNYMADGSGFADSRMHYLGSTGTGRAISDLPLFYYGPGKLWRVIGKKEWTYRLAVLALFMAGLASLFLLLRNLLHDGFLATMIVGLLFTSPMVAYYANNFLMNSPALSLVLIAWYFVSRYVRDQRSSSAIAAIGLFTLAGLLKATAALSLLSVMIICAVHASPLQEPLLPDLKLRHMQAPILFAGCSFLSMGLWYTFAHDYNVQNSSGVFLVGTLPYWKATPDQVKDVWTGIDHHLKRDYFRPDFYFVLSGALGFLIWRWRSVSRSLLLLLALVLAGSLCICLLFFQALRDHDYYSLDQVFLVPMVLALAVLAAQATAPGQCGRGGCRVAMVAFGTLC
ncbi:MAG: glycosyltransferase family 39 protein [Flavobacteriales bacterium]|nr:glycosyltransferase family 39 protein [Flavobacteriales bacterium]